MKKYSRYIIRFFVIVMILGVAYYILRQIPIRDDHILIDDLSQTKKILIILPKYDSIYFQINGKDDRQKLEFKKLELIIKEPGNRIVFSTSKYGIRGRSIEPITFEPCFFSDQDACPPLWFLNAVTAFLKPGVPLELEINYQGSVKSRMKTYEKR